MKWEADQRLGFFGFDAPTRKGATEQPRHFKLVDIEQALLSAGRALDVWVEARKYPDLPPYSGGVLDSWPAWAVDAIFVCRVEEAAITDYRRHLEASHA